MQININVTEKQATAEGNPAIICGNTDYTVAFNFDAEWDAHDTKTARFAFQKGNERQFVDVIFTGTTCQVPMLSNITLVEIGVYAGELCTTTGAPVPCKKSILCGTSEPATPSGEIILDTETMDHIDAQVAAADASADRAEQTAAVLEAVTQRAEAAAEIVESELQPVNEQISFVRITADETRDEVEFNVKPRLQTVEEEVAAIQNSKVHKQSTNLDPYVDWVYTLKENGLAEAWINQERTVSTPTKYTFEELELPQGLQFGSHPAIFLSVSAANDEDVWVSNVYLSTVSGPKLKFKIHFSTSSVTDTVNVHVIIKGRWK